MLTGFYPADFEYYSAMWCMAVDTRLILLVRVVNEASLLAGGSGLHECNLFDRRPHTVLCVLYKIKSNPMHPLCRALTVLFVSVWVTRGALVAHRYSHTPPRCRTSKYCNNFIPHSVSLENDLGDSVFNGVRLAGFKTKVNASLLA